MRDLDSPSIWATRDDRIAKHHALMRGRRLSKFKARYKQPGPYIIDFIEREDVFNFLCAQPPEMK